MTQPPGTGPTPRRTPLSVEEKNRAEVNFAPYAARTLVSEGRFRVSADTPEMVELFQRVARRVGDMLRRPVVSYADGREIVITFGPDEAHGLTGQDRSIFSTRVRPNEPTAEAARYVASGTGRIPRGT